MISPQTSLLKPFKVWCDFFDGHGWTVFQKRFNGSVDFYRSWNEYEDGFGSITGEHWLGLDKLHAITQTNRKLNVLVKDANGHAKSGTWLSFFIGDSVDKYRLHVSNAGYTGTLSSTGLDWHNNMQFTTKDRDNDMTSDNCSARYHGAWWYKNCHRSNLNGQYNGYRFSGVWWYGFSDDLRQTVMKVTRD
ncbi:ficolin-2-like [Watersipora subatra]|uniref:ficolin-2-like n=1 Tax=Watersipora subatra TaxID=2589382 RepID=UPI00355B7561